ncbi:threonine ammonia-lyase [Aliikangiella coralliicola]|uniref:Threonine/serine dehydratase n=1 Tax=Aliikangiella coralliicola TaxID=2592383 RepID=A0A545UEQ0_9GAMM|nr:threonine/serine dehydratase [Aliikangiella coralliicola]TQV87915.1 threonine/serine dehydratase [Aliikangiella coralliicola]
MIEKQYGITLSDILKAHQKISGIAFNTPLKQSFELSAKLNRNIWLKLENMQPTGAFKIRGAANKILSLDEKFRSNGVITTSSGNHGRAVAYLAAKLNIPATVCMTEIVPQEKVEKIKMLGANVIIHGTNQDQASEKALTLAQKEGLTFVPPFDDPHIIAGQGTIGLEIIEENQDIDTLVVQVSGGGLMSGIAIAAKSINPKIKIIGVTSEKGAAIYESIKAGKIVTVDEPVSLADALPGPIPKDNQYTFQICRDLVDEIIPVSDDLIAKAMVHAFKKEKLVLEGGGAASIALLMTIPPEKLGKNVAAICSGDNVNPEKILELTKTVEI